MISIKAPPFLSTGEQRTGGGARHELWLTIAIFLLSALRLTQFFRYPAFYAEDGSPFFIDSIELGVKSIILPLTHYDVLGRLGAYLATRLPISRAPLFYQIFAGLVSSWCFAIFARPTFRWLVADDRARVLCCFAFSLVPGTAEIYFVLSTLYYPLSCAAFFLLLEQDAQGDWLMSPGKALFLGFLWFSIAQGLLFLPGVLFLAWKSRKKTYLIVLYALLCSVYLNYRASVDPVTGAQSISWQLSELPLLTRVYLDNLFGRMIFLPLFGIGITRLLLSAPDFVYAAFCVGAFALCAAFILKVFKRGNEAEQLVLILVLSLAFVPSLTAHYRTYGADMLSRPNLCLGLRYSVLPAVHAVLIYAVLLLSPRLQRYALKWRLILLLAVTANILQEPFWVKTPPYPEFLDSWPAQSSAIEKALEKKSNHTLSEPVVIRNISCLPPGFPHSHNELIIRP